MTHGAAVGQHARQNGRGRFFRGYRRRRAARRDDHRDLAADQIGGHVGQLVVLARSPAVFDRDTPALNKAGIGKSLPEGCDALGVAVG